MPTHPTLQDLRAALEAAQAALDGAQAAYVAAGDKRDAARRQMLQARRAVEEARERAARNEIGRDRRKAKALAEQYGVQIDWDAYSPKSGDGVWWVLGPKALYGGGDGIADEGQAPVRADPCEGDHTCSSWSEVLDHVQAYVVDILKMPPTVVSFGDRA